MELRTQEEKGKFTPPKLSKKMSPKKPRARLPSALEVLKVCSVDHCPPEGIGLEREEEREAGAGRWHVLSGLPLGSSLFTA